MSQADFWYVRFPDGRILRAASTAILRQEVVAGHIPLTSTVRRTPSDEWVSLEWTEEFADLVVQRSSQPAPPAPTPEPEPRRRKAPSRSTPANVAPNSSATVGSRLDSSRLHLVGVRAYLDELLAALDSTFIAKKLLLGVAAGLILSGLLVLGRTTWFERDSRWLVPACCVATVAMIVLDFLTGLLTRLTYIELSRLRPAHWNEGLAGIGPLTLRLFLSQVIVRGGAWGLIVLLRWLPYWVGPSPEEPGSLGQQIAGGTTLAAGMVLEALLWPIFFFWWLTPTVLVVEDCSVGNGIRLWLLMLRRHLGQVFVYQTMAVGLAVLMTAPFVVLIAPLFVPTFCPPEGLDDVVGATRSLLLGLACAPMLTYWIVANVFIYLNLRYGAGSQR